MIHPHQLAVVEADSCGAGLAQSLVVHSCTGAVCPTAPQRDSHSLSGRRSPQTRLLQPQCSAAQHSTAAGAAQSAVLGSVAFAAQHRVVCARPIPSAAIPDPGSRSRAAAGWRAQNSTTAGRALAV